MLSKYFKFKIRTNDFIKNTEEILKKYNGKRVLICGDAESFMELNKRYHFDQGFDIVAFVHFGKTKKLKLRTITPEQIPAEKFDLILITGEEPDKIYSTLFYDLNLEKVKIEKLFFEDITDGKKNLEFLLKTKFEKRLRKLKRRLKNKKIILYGAGAFFELINKYFDLSELDIIAITDKKFKDTDNIKEFCGYKVCKPEQIKSLHPDIVLISLKRFIPVWEDLYFGVCRRTNIGIKCIIKMKLIDLLFEIADT